jgi:hypothetical protein
MTSKGLGLGLWALPILAAGVLAAAAPALAQSQDAKSPVRIDLSGYWTNRSLTTLERPDHIPTVDLSEADASRFAGNDLWARLKREQASEVVDVDRPPTPSEADLNTRAHAAFWVDPGTMFAKVKGSYRSSAVVDPPNGRIPWRPDAQQVFAEYSRQPAVGGFEHYEQRPLAERCLIGSAPVMISVLYNNTYQFIQTRDHVVIVIEMAHDARVIPVFATAQEARANHRPADIKPWMGDSVGWYEKGALIVETVRTNSIQRRHITDAGKVTERFTRPTPEETLYEFTVEDPTLYVQPWKGELVFKATKERPYEYACHEGNYSMPGILRGAREEERKGRKVADLSAVEE